MYVSRIDAPQLSRSMWLLISVYHSHPQLQLIGCPDFRTDRDKAVTGTSPVARTVLETEKCDGMLGKKVSHDFHIQLCCHLLRHGNMTASFPLVYRLG